MEKYALIVAPPKDICDFVDGYRQKFSTKPLYKIPPHVTVYPPFFNQYPTFEKLTAEVSKTFRSTDSKEVIFNGISFFTGENNVAYFEPDEASQIYLRGLFILTTTTLSSHIKNAFDNYNFSPEKFHPHITIAEQLSSEELTAAQVSLENAEVSFSFLVNSVCLYQQAEDSRIWSGVAEVNFSTLGNP